MRTTHSDAVRATLPDDREKHGDWQLRCFSSFQEAAVVIETVVSAMAESGYPPKDIFGTRLALEEAICNAIKHGHRHDPTKVVAVRYSFRSDHFLAEVQDQGPGFVPSQVPDATAPENLECPSGRGLLLIRHYAAWVRHNREGNAIMFCICPSEPLLAPNPAKPLLAVTL